MNDFKEYSELYHHGIKGQRWGVRRYQNPDGSLTAEGKRKYLNSDGTLNRQGELALKKKLGVKNKIKTAAGVGLGVAGSLYGYGKAAAGFEKVKFYKELASDYAKRGSTYQAKHVLNNAKKASRRGYAGLAIAGAAIAGMAFVLYKNHKNKKQLENNGKQYVDQLINKKETIKKSGISKRR